MSMHCYQCKHRTTRALSITKGGRLYCSSCWYENDIHEMNLKIIRKLESNPRSKDPTCDEYSLLRDLRMFNGL